VIYQIQFYIGSALCILFTYCFHHFSLSNDASYLWQMMCTPTGEFILDVPKFSVGGAGASHPMPHGTAPTSPPPPPPPVSIEQLLAMLNELMWVLMEKMAHRGGRQPHHQPVLDSYTRFLETHPPTFIEVSDVLKADNLLHITESKSGLLQCTEYEKTLYAAQQLRGTRSIISLIELSFALLIGRIN
jgi:hypothetical protein